MSRAALITLSFALIAVPSIADACSCGVPSVCQRFLKSPVVFAGQVAEVTAEPGRKVARLRVLRSYKGPARAGDVVTLLLPPGTSARCSLDLEPGERLVVFAGHHEGTFATHMCAGNLPIEPGAPVPDLPPPGGQVTGRLVRFGSDPRAEPTPIAGALVWVPTDGGRIEGRTGVDGRFRLGGVPAGRRDVQFEIGASERATAVIELQSKDDCAEVSAAPRSPR